ncbi:hypothetical protein HUE87_09295 [Candidatus Sulfurimonas marisnigri]|uniref:Uncharacterized protein n=1 Tax=Candidatus Sulfurimonas marisnigri TaxID=2740405 RepID=A0A7S7RPX0_9BACT|nr:hypothetical protein [Candidatus Sulfurimonas marisnigri]QOY54071.1 hypothetical protein HUE87_09295 [Candidatus Sulfurimonas marisnigri]
MKNSEKLFVSKNLNKEYINIFIVDSFSLWNKNAIDYDLKKDLVLTFDFELKDYINSLGGESFYIDHLIDNTIMQNNNFLIYKFFTNWHYNKNNEDIFTYKGIPFGFSFRQEFWNDFTFYIRLYINLQSISKINHKNLYLFSNNKSIEEILVVHKLKFSKYICKENEDISFYFPIEQWMNEKVRAEGLRGFLRKYKSLCSSIYSSVIINIDKLLTKKKNIFIQEHHPTKKIIKKIRNSSDKRVLLENFSQKTNLSSKFKERTIPIFGKIEEYDNFANSLIGKFYEEKYHKLILEDGSDISELVYKIIINRIAPRLSHFLRTLNNCIRYTDKNKVDLVVLIANIGHTATLFDLVCKSKNIPSYLIINGLLGPEYSDEAKYATIINSYSVSIKENYFKNMENIVTLGDPRMDDYACENQNKINRVMPVITIGTSGYNPVDLNSYVAVEFDFLYDVLFALKKSMNKNVLFKINIKVRSNGYKKQYDSFVKKYFSELNITVIENTPMKTVLKKTDFYVSIYSQTLFEASCLGIPVIYYKKDNEIMMPPFDNNSELVTVSTVEDFIEAFDDFQNKNKRYDAFLDRTNMEKYIGPLDGKNLDRNLQFIYKLLNIDGLNA